jgi:tight adherence protein C
MIETRLLVLSGLAAAAAALGTAALAVLLRDRGLRRLQQRVDAYVGGIMPAHTGDATRRIGSALDLIGRFGEHVRRSTKLYSAQDLEALSAMLHASGFDARRAMPVVIGIKLMLLVLLPTAAVLYGWLAGLSGMHRLLVDAAAMLAGLLGPDWVLGLLRRRHLKQIRLGISDALDLLVVCCEAGMGLESALDQVAHEMQHSNAPTAMVLSTFLDELRLLPDRREAFANLGNRLGLTELRRMAAMLAQSQRYGSPLSQALRAVSAELRRERMIRMEEKAVRLPAMLVFPLILFILPTLFIVLIGPAGLQLMKALHAGN